MSVDPMKALRDRKQEIIDELARIERAMLALTGDNAVTTARKPQQSRSGKKRRGPKPSSTSVKSRVGKLLAEADRKWRVNDILAEFAARRAPLTASSPKDATRTALTNLIKAGEVVRIEEGLYTHANWVRQQLDDSPEEDEGGDDANMIATDVVSATG